ncbi:hypothetical protein HX448_09010 [Dehalogenimonas etheniformans]|uniref:Uncharacterized protein n=1 Tax=Dehalogenimonas etheniformans TaxID=1536648 RepID=A0A2P5P5I3_9CHLR|nr:hypothetical protein JP09_008910 [Dehalogenimonas etheniformans]QNT77173.1 hypothetical protein HX448_09010 [Dehalogenimonas etheniformans]
MAESSYRAIQHLRSAIQAGARWYLALLEAIGMWQADEECVDGRVYKYLIEGEALDFLLLAERLTETARDLIPEQERVALLFNSKAPLEVSPGEMRRLMGDTRYQQHLNYFYGITVEEALILAVQEEVRKDQRSLVIKEFDTIEESFVRIYDQPRSELLKMFRRDRGERTSRSLKLSEMREFTYWLFKYRLKHTDKARVASDTKKALTRLKKFPGRSGSPGLDQLLGV